MKTLHTQRLTLRAWKLSDAEDLFSYARNPLVGPPAGWAPHQSLKESTIVIRDIFMKSPFHWALTLTEEQKAFGSIGLIRDPKRNNPHAWSLGYSMSRDYWGKGYMSEAAITILAYGFFDLGCAVISAYHYPENLRSKHVIETCGFRYEGQLRKCSKLFDGSVHDNCCYSLTREEFVPAARAWKTRQKSFAS